MVCDLLGGLDRLALVRSCSTMASTAWPNAILEGDRWSRRHVTQAPVNRSARTVAVVVPSPKQTSSVFGNFLHLEPAPMRLERIVEVDFLADRRRHPG